MEKTRLDVLVKTLGISKEAVSTRSSQAGQAVDPNANEFIVKEGKAEVYYNVLKADELDDRVQELINDLYSEEEIAETYGLDENGEPDLSSADINTYMELVEEIEAYFIYTPE